MSQTYQVGRDGKTKVVANRAALQAACGVLNRNKHRGQENWEIHSSENNRETYYGVIARMGNQTAYQIDCLEALLLARYYNLALV